MLVLTTFTSQEAVFDRMCVWITCEQSAGVPRDCPSQTPWGLPLPVWRGADSRRKQLLVGQAGCNHHNKRKRTRVFQILFFMFIFRGNHGFVSFCYVRMVRSWTITSITCDTFGVFLLCSFDLGFITVLITVLIPMKRYIDDSHRFFFLFFLPSFLSPSSPPPLFIENSLNCVNDYSVKWLCPSQVVESWPRASYSHRCAITEHNWTLSVIAYARCLIKAYCC